jgi:L-threonylcarbamoyladenylate synthase
VGIESTVLDLTAATPRVLRPGMIHEQALLAVTAGLAGAGGDEEVLKSPGLLPRHYSPKARLVILSWRDEADLERQIGERRLPAAHCHIIAHTRIPSGGNLGRISVLPHDVEAFARAIYAELHRCDEAGADLIVVESVPEANEWRAIADRLRRAAAS